MGSILKGVGKLFGYDQSAITKAAKEQAKATRESAQMSAADAAQQVQANTQAQATAQANKLAASAAEDLLSKPVDTVDVSLAPDTSTETDDLTGKQTRRRSAFLSGGSNSGAGVNVAAS